MSNKPWQQQIVFKRFKTFVHRCTAKSRFLTVCNEHDKSITVTINVQKGTDYFTAFYKIAFLRHSSKDECNFQSANSLPLKIGLFLEKRLCPECWEVGFKKMKNTYLHKRPSNRTCTACFLGQFVSYSRINLQFDGIQQLGFKIQNSFN